MLRAALYLSCLASASTLSIVPKPQKQEGPTGPLAIAHTFAFAATGKDSPLLQAAFKRYSALILGGARSGAWVHAAYARLSSGRYAAASSSVAGGVAMASYDGASRRAAVLLGAEAALANGTLRLRHAARLHAAAAPSASLSATLWRVPFLMSGCAAVPTPPRLSMRVAIDAEGGATLRLPALLGEEALYLELSGAVAE